MKALYLPAAALAACSLLSAQSFISSVPVVTTNGIPVGLDTDLSGTTLYLTDIGAADEVGVVDPSTGAYGGNVNVTANTGNPIGVTTDGTNIYITDTTGQDVDVYDLTLTYISSFSVAAETTFPEGIAYNPNTGNLYVVDGTGGNQALEYDTAGTFIAGFPLNGASIDGIAHDPSDDSYWIYDSSTDSIRNYDNAFVEQSASPGTAANGLSTGEGVGLIGTDLYICATGSDAIARFSTVATPATVTPYGAGCPAAASAAFYEQFVGIGTNDLSGLAITCSPNGSGGYDVSAGGTFNPGFANNLNLGDDQLSAGNALGFTVNVPGAGMVSTLDVDSNGRAGFGLAGSDFSETVPEFIAQNLLAPNWDDLNPSAGGAVYFDAFATFAMATWDQIPQFGNTDSNTFQLQIYASGDIVMAWQAVADDAIVGFSDGAGQDPGGIDISAATPFSTAGVSPLTLTSDARPVLGTTINLTVGPLAGATSGAVVFGIMQDNATFPGVLPSGCTVYTSNDLSASLPFPSGTIPVAIPNVSVIIGTNAYCQGVVCDFSATPLPVYLSNGLDLFIGDA